MTFRYMYSCILVLIFFMPLSGRAEQQVPDAVYDNIEYILQLTQSSDAVDADKTSDIVEFIRSTPTGTSIDLKDRHGASGAFHAFSVKSDFSKVLDYVYNPEIPVYVTMPSSLRLQEWLTPQIGEKLKELPNAVLSQKDTRILRGKDREIITPDINTGGYYGYTQDRMVVTFPGATGPVLISVSNQNDLSDVGKRGCVVGNDQNWNYLYSDEKGLNKTGLEWVSSYLYKANSLVIYVVDTKEHTVRVGSFKWLDAGWAKINMVKSSHILSGIKRFAANFKEILESPGLPDAKTMAGKYKELKQSSEENLRSMVSAYLKALHNSGAAEVQSNPFNELLESGEYLKNMNKEEMVKVLLLEYVKNCIGKEPLVHFANQQATTGKASASVF